MSRLLYSAAMSLDGFIAGAGGDMSWLSARVGADAAADATDTVDGAESFDVDALTAQIGALLIGRTTFTGDDPNRGTDREGAFGGTWHGPSIVLTHDVPAGAADRDPDDPDVTYAGDLETAVRLAKEAAGGRYVTVLGADVAAQCVAAGLLDELLVFIAPVLLGDGTRLFEHPGGTNVRLEPLDPSDVGPTRLWFRVAGAGSAGGV